MKAPDEALTALPGSPISPELAAPLEDVEFLTPFGVEMRYPGDIPALLPGQEKSLSTWTRDAPEAQLGL
jgi:hypothetical protein